MKILGIDPGPKGKGCGAALIDDSGLIASGMVEAHDTALDMEYVYKADAVVIEMISCYGMAVGMSTFQTLIEAGRIIQIVLQERTPVYLMPRKDIKMVICGTAQAKDKNVRAAILSRFPESGGGKTPQIGTKSQPGPLYGVSAHVWPAIAAALSYSLAMPERGIDIEQFQYTEKKWMDYTTKGSG